MTRSFEEETEHLMQTYWEFVDTRNLLLSKLLFYGEDK